MCKCVNDTIFCCHVVMAVSLKVLICVCCILYTLVDRIMLYFGMILVSRKVFDPSGHVSYTMSIKAWSIELICCRKFALCSVLCMTKMSSTYLCPQPGWVLCSSKRSGFKVFHIYIGSYMTDWGSHGHSNWSQNYPWNKKNVM